MFAFDGKDEKPRRREERACGEGEAANTRIFIYANGMRSRLIVRPHTRGDSRDGYPGVNRVTKVLAAVLRSHLRNFRLGAHLRYTDSTDLHRMHRVACAIRASYVQMPRVLSMRLHATCVA